MEEMHPIAARFQLVAEELMKRRTVILTQINEESVGDIISRLLLLQTESSDPINILIDSGGGNGQGAFLICDLMEHMLTAPVRGIAVGACGSAATFIMLYCSERWATPHASFLIHSGTVNDVSLTMDTATAKRLEQLLNETKRSSERVIQMYMEKLNKTREDVESYIARGDQAFDELMTAEEALEIGLIQKIVTGKLDIFSSERVTSG